MGMLSGFKDLNLFFGQNSSFPSLCRVFKMSVFS